MSMATARVPLLNVANALTGLRLALVPVFAVVLLADEGRDMTWRLVATGLFLLAALTDRLDGHLARTRNLVTDLGKIADPIADKALIGTALVILSLLGELPWWVTSLILVREIGITLLRLAVLRVVVIPASAGGKVKTVLQVAAIGAFLLPIWSLDWARVGAWIIMAAAIGVTVATGLDYIFKAASAVGAARSASSAARLDAAAPTANASPNPAADDGA